MKPHRILLCATVALVLAVLAAPPASAQGNSNCATRSVSAGTSCVIQGYLATFSASAAGNITLGSLTIDLTAGSVTMAPSIQGPPLLRWRDRARSRRHHPREGHDRLHPRGSGQRPAQRSPQLSHVHGHHGLCRDDGERVFE